MNLLAINWQAVFQSFVDTWLPFIIPMALLFLFFLSIAFLRKGDKDD